MPAPMMQTCALSSLLKGFSTGVPAVAVSRRVDFAVAGNLFSRIKYGMDVDRYFCISRGVMEVMRAAGVPEARLALVPSGIALPTHAGGTVLPPFDAATGCTLFEPASARTLVERFGCNGVQSAGREFELTVLHLE